MRYAPTTLSPGHAAFPRPSWKPPGSGLVALWTLVPPPELASFFFLVTLAEWAGDASSLPSLSAGPSMAIRRASSHQL